MRYKIVLEVSGIDMYSVVMKTVEGNRGIKVVESGMVIEPHTKTAPITRHRSKGKTRFEDTYYNSLVERGLVGQIVTTQTAMDWLKANEFSEASATSINSVMVKRGMLERVAGRKGTYKVLAVQLTLPGNS